MFETAVEIGVQAFASGAAGQEDEDVLERLLAQGVKPWLAERLVVFLPIAFGRFMLRGANFRPHFIDGEVTRRLDDDPVYRAAWDRANRATNSEMHWVGCHSAAMNAARQLLRPDSRPSDLVFAEDRRPQPLPPSGKGDGGVPEPRALLAQALARRGIKTRSRDTDLWAGKAIIDAHIHPAPAGQTERSGVLVRVIVTIDGPGPTGSTTGSHVLEGTVVAAGSTWRELIGSAMDAFTADHLDAVVTTLSSASRPPALGFWQRLRRFGWG